MSDPAGGDLRGSHLIPLVHVDDLADLVLRCVSDGTARGVFHAAEPRWARRDTAPTALQIGEECSHAAGRGGATRRKPKRTIMDQALGVANSLSLGWRPRRFDAQAEWRNYLATKAAWRRRQTSRAEREALLRAAL